VGIIFAPYNTVVHLLSYTAEVGIAGWIACGSAPGAIPDIVK
jgi:hypothetical protein